MLADLFQKWDQNVEYKAGSGAVRKGNLKLIEWYEKSLLNEGGSPYELFNLDEDIGETINLADSLESITMELAGDLLDWREMVQAQMPSPNDKRGD